MRKIVTASVKGGVGKTWVTARLGLSLKNRGFEVGLLDLDTGGPTLYLALGLNKPPQLELDTKNSQLIPSNVNGLKLVTMASHFGEGTRILWRGKDKANLAQELLTTAINWDKIDYLLIDTPPSVSEENLTLFDLIGEIWGYIIVTQPTDFSVADIDRLLDILRDKRLPLLGIISNFDSCLCPNCQASFYPFNSKAIDILNFCQINQVPFLSAIPLTTELGMITEVFVKLSHKIINSEPVRLPSRAKKRLAKRELIKLMFKGDT